MDKYSVLKHYFGYTSFRGGQERLIDSAVIGRDVLGIMPTGGGKSLCYQIPALIFSGITLVVSPLISLMRDQVMALKNANVAAAYINSSLTYEQLIKVYANLRRGMYKIVYIAPERLESEGFRETAMYLPISMVAVDEAHCISQWGNDFRPSYLKIADFIESLPHRPVVAAFTATATERVRQDIESKLRLLDPERVITGFDRPNLSFEVLNPRKKRDEILYLVNRRREKSGIIYCMTRSNVEKICALLNENGIAATRYHAGLDDDERHRNQEDFVYDRKNVMVATNAFGMGIDKSNVSYVIHYNMPMSLEAYYQEAGRAGRDGDAAECILLYSPSDIQTAKMLIDLSEPAEEITEEQREEQRRRDLQRLDRMIAYCKTTKCLRGDILEYFGQEHPEKCNNCGNCTQIFANKDITLDAQKILSCVKRVNDHLGYSVGAGLITRVLHGSEEKRLLELGLHTLSTYAIMKENPSAEIGDMIDYLFDCGYLVKSPEFGSLSLSDKADEILYGGKRITRECKETLRVPSGKKRTDQHADSSADPELYERLRGLRSSIASEIQMPAYIVFSNATLSDMVNKKPRDIYEFLQVSGVGENKAKLYGSRFIKEINAYLNEEK